jgi:hypothetical protein
MTKKLNLKGALEHVRFDRIPAILSWEDDKLSLFLEKLLFQYVHNEQPHLVVPLSCLGTWRDLGIACVPEARQILTKRSQSMRIELGMTVRDVITGLTGVAVCRSTYLTGCDRISIQPLEIKDGKPSDWVAFDENQLEIVKGKKVIVLPSDKKGDKPGGPRPDVARR